MVGFKSFADETIIEPGTGMTAIVGPNGCGKSNIVDALRWVLGEKSGRALRGKSMEDVIFLGSERRKQSGMAEVELHFDNSDRSLPLDQDEFSIGRRLYLNSASEYLLNGRRTTRKEIEKIFMDTGIGKSAYSIMEQGRMSEILRASADERRLLFDEAAGVSRFKAERQETLARLKDTEQNMLRLGDILKEKEKELEHLERQARKTREYLKLKDYLDKHDKNIRYIKLTDLQQKKSQVDEKLTALRKKREEVFSRVEENESQAEELEKQNQQDLESMHELDRLYHQSLSVIESIQKQSDRITHEISELEAKNKVTEEQLRNEDKTLRSTEKKMQDSMQLELDLESEIKVLNDSANKLQANIEELEKTVRETVETEEKNIIEIQRIDTRQDELLDQLRKLTEDLITQIETHKKEIEQGEQKREELSGLIHEELKQFAAAVADLSQLKAGDSLEPFLERLKPDVLKKHFNRYQKAEQSLRSLFFGKSGLLARKKEIDDQMTESAERKALLQSENDSLFEKRKLALKQIDKEKNRRVEMQLQIRDFQARKESSQENREAVQTQIDQSKARIEYLQNEHKSTDTRIRELKEETAQIKEEIKNRQKETGERTKTLEQMRKNISKLRDRITQMREQAKKDREQLEKTVPDITKEERAAENIQVALSATEGELYNDYQMSPSELIEQCKDEKINREYEFNEFKRIKGEIQALGTFNALAIEEYQRSEESMKELLGQKKDIENARDDILSILAQIDEKSRAMFKDTFERIQLNFSEVFQTLFNGGNASLTLTDEEDPINSGVNIMVQPPGKKNSSISLLSGGEQNMTAIALMFATYLVRPSPFCLLDEIDAPLDDTNVHRFLKMLQGFSQRSQFLIITHNKITMEKAEAIFGVTQEEPGVTSIVSVRFQSGRDSA